MKQLLDILIFFTEHLKETVNFTLSKELRTELEQAVLGLRVMPSMRCIMTAGETLKARKHCRGITVHMLQ